MSFNRKQGYLQHKKYNMSIIENFIRLLAPYPCLQCGTEGAFLCTACEQMLPPVPSRCYRCQCITEEHRTCKECCARSPLWAVYVATPYQDLAKQVVHSVKFARASAAAEVIARSLAGRLPAFPDRLLVTHIPTANQRVRARGYDQAALIARAVAKQIGATSIPLLVRTGNQRQVGQNRAQRQQQMHGAFGVRYSAIIHNSHVLIIDDVITTGSTAEAAGLALQAAGATKVSAAFFAAA